MSIGFGVVGTGMMGGIYVRALRQMVDGADVVAVQGGSRAAELAAEVDVSVEPTLDALLARPQRRRDPPREPHPDAPAADARRGRRRQARVHGEADRGDTARDRPDGGGDPRRRRAPRGEHRHALSDRLPVGEAAHRRGRDRRAAHGPPHLRPHRLGLPAEHWINRPEAGSPWIDQGSHCSTPSAGSWATRSIPCTPAITTTRRTPRPTRAR